MDTYIDDTVWQDLVLDTVCKNANQKYFQELKWVWKYCSSSLPMSFTHIPIVKCLNFCHRGSEKEVVASKWKSLPLSLNHVLFQDTWLFTWRVVAGILTVALSLLTSCQTLNICHQCRAHCSIIHGSPELLGGTPSKVSSVFLLFDQS